MLCADSLSVLRGDRAVLRGVSLRAALGEAWVLRGPNGVGKTTLLRVLAGLHRPDAGRVAWAGLVPKGGYCRFVGVRDAVKPQLTVAENLSLGLGGADPAPALRAMGLDALAGRLGRALSTGQRRRLALARLAVSFAPCWLLDEPALGLDGQAMALLGGLLARHRAQGGLVVAATHQDLPLPGAQDFRLGG